MADDSIEVNPFDSSPERNKAQLNISLSVTVAVCIVFLFLSMSFGEALSDNEGVVNADEWWEVPLEKRHLMDLNFSSWRSTLPEQGTYDWTGPTEHYVEVELPPS